MAALLPCMWRRAKYTVVGLQKAAHYNGAFCSASTAAQALHPPPPPTHQPRPCPCFLSTAHRAPYLIISTMIHFVSDLLSRTLAQVSSA